MGTLLQSLCLVPILAAVVAVAASRLADAQTVDAWRLPSAKECTDVIPSVRPAQRIDAMLAVRRFARTGEGALPREALTLLACDEDTAAGARLRRAVAQLAAWRGAEPGVAGVLGELGFPDALFVTVLDGTFPDPPAAGPAEVALALEIGLQGVEGSWTSELCRETEKLSERDPVISHGPIITAEAEFRVKRPFDEVRLILDPQEWDEHSEFFAKPPERTHLVLGDLADCASHPIDTSVPAGTTYAGRVLFEHFHESLWGVEFVNRLRVSATYDTAAPSYVATYWLIASCEAPKGVELEIDDGEIRVEKDGDWTNVYLSKRLAFGNAYDKMLAEIALTFGEFAGQVRDMVSCP